MKIVYKQPPNISDIRAVFPLVRGIVFTYGNILYNPDRAGISADLMVHEETHARQQGKDPDRWWKRYFVDIDFRLEQELEAYRNQYKYAVENYTRQARRFLLQRISRDLSRPMYGGIITKEKAKEEIKKI